MYPTASLCRSQEAYHRDRAAGAQLENVRAIAKKAAMAWEQEALAAERREERHSRTKAIAGILALEKGKARDAQDGLFGEHPDRGFESPSHL